MKVIIEYGGNIATYYDVFAIIQNRKDLITIDFLKHQPVQLSTHKIDTMEILPDA